jgi:bifunctional non-homologous end joining protein LigD
MKWWSNAPVKAAPGFVAPCLPTAALRAPAGLGWVYEIKHDGCRLMVRRAGDRVRIYTRRGADWTHRFPRIVEGVRRLRVSSVLLDGEGVICNDNGLAICDRLHSKKNDDDVFLYTFDLLELDGEDWRREPLGERKIKLKRLLARANDGVQYNEHLVNDGRVVFEHACQFGCEGIVAKRLDSPYQSGRSKTWIKVKNPHSPAAARIEEGAF